MSDAEALVRAACSSDPRPAAALLAAEPAISRHDIAAGCVAGNGEYVAELLTGDPAAAREPVAPFGWEPILYATFSRLPRADPDRGEGTRTVVALLLDAGADPNASFDHEGWRQVPLYGAAGILNDVQLTAMLIAAGADPNDRGTRKVGEALYHGCEFPDPACAALLIDAGTTPAVVDYCLGRALNFPYAEVIEMFCAHGAHASADHLMQAAWRRRPARTVRVLLDAGAPVDARESGGGATALQIATRWAQLEVAELLHERGADAAAVTDADRALGALVSGAGAPPPRADVTPLDAMLLMAVEQGDAAAAGRLLDAGAQVQGAPGGEEVPLGHAAWRGYPGLVSLLVARGAALEFGDGGSAMGAALHGSRHCNHPEGGPTMQTVGEIPQAPYAEVVRTLLAAGGRVPAAVRWARAPPPETMVEELLTGGGA
jgi:ankyrin repeat protein